MNRSFLFALFIVLCVLFLLFMPIVIESDAHCDLNRKKFGFAVFLFKKIKLIGGYITTYTGGIAVHITQKKAILIPYKQMNSERKKFSFIRTFRLISFKLTTETGAEYLLPIGIMHTALRAYFFASGGEKDKIENNLWLTDGDTLRVSLNFVAFFNGYILLKNVLKFIKEKIEFLWRKKRKQSAV